MKRNTMFHMKRMNRALRSLSKGFRFIIVFSFAFLLSATYLNAQTDLRVDLSTLNGSASGNWNSISLANANSTTSNLIDHTTGGPSPVSITGSGWEGEWSGSIPSGAWFDGGDGMKDRLYCNPNTPTETASFTFSNLDDALIYQLEIVSEGDNTYSLITANGSFAGRSQLGNTVDPWHQNTPNDWLIWDGIQPVSGQIVITISQSSGSYLNMDLIRLAEPYTITYNLDDGINDAGNPDFYTSATPDITLANASKIGYTFEGWYAEEALTTPVSSIDLGSAGDVELWAKWATVDYSITYNLNGGTNNAGNPTYFTIETPSIILINASKNGYTFKGWFTDEALTSPETTIDQGSSNDVEVWAKWLITDYSITYNLDGGTNDVNNPASYTIETPSITLVDATKDGYTFMGWYAEEALTTQVSSIYLGSKGDETLWAKWTITDNSITYNLDGGINDAGNPSSYTVETPDITLADASKDAYTFMGWYAEEALTTLVTSIDLGNSGDVELWAKWAADEYSITYTLDGGTNDAGNPAIYTIETPNITLLDATKDGYTFMGWYAEEALTTQVSSIDLGSTGNVELWAKWATTDYSITYDLDDGTNDASNPASYTIETPNITLADASKDAYTFLGWYAEEALTTQVNSIDLGSMGNVELWAKWAATDYSITYNLDGGTNDASNPASYTIETLDITLADASKDAYTFLGWYAEAALTTQVSSIDLGSSGNVELWAKWEKINTSNMGLSLEEISIYPNPTSDLLYIKTSSNRNISIKLMNINGSLILDKIRPNTHIDLSDLPNGVYFLSVDSHTYKIMKN